MGFDQREIDVLIKIHQEGMAPMLAAVKELTAAVGHDGGGSGGGNSGGNTLTNAFQSMFRAWQGMPAMAQGITAGVVLATTVFTPFTAAIIASVANIAAMTAIAGVAIGTIGALGFAIFQLGAANAGGLNPAAEMIKTQKALETAVKEHVAALKELDQVKAGQGKDIYGAGLSQAQMLNIAKTYVGVTGAAVTDAQRNLAEPMSGLGKPIGNLGTAIDDMHDHFEKASRKIADAIATFLIPYVDKIQALGDQLIKWFGDRLPQILTFASGLIKELGRDFGGAGQEIGKIVDYVLSHQADFIGFFGNIVKIGVGAFVWLLQAAIDIHEWFKKNWPVIMGMVSAFADGFKVWAPVIGEQVKELKGLLKDVGDHIKDLTPLWQAMGFVIGAVVTAALSALGGLLFIIRAIQGGLEAIAKSSAGVGHGPGGGGGKFGGGHPQNGLNPTGAGNPLYLAGTNGHIGL